MLALPPVTTQATRRVSITIDGRTHLVEFTRREPSLRHEIFVGDAIDQTGHVVLAVDRQGVAAGDLQLGDRAYSLGYSGAGKMHVVRAFDATKLPSCATDHRHEIDATPDPRKTTKGSAPRTASANADTTLDVCVFYTPRARSTGGGKAAIEAEIALRIANASIGADNSRVQAQFRLVYVAETNYVETGATNDLSRFRNRTDGIMDEVHAARTTYGGDLMALITQPTSPRYCGVGYLMTSLNTGFRTSAFSVTLRQCLRGQTLTHEMGHNIGSHHDQANAGRAIYPYSYGWRTPDNRYRSIMSYSPGSRINYFSNPSVRYQNYVMGSATADNARSINATRVTVSRFNTTKTYEWCELPRGIRGQRGIPALSGQGTVNRVVPIRWTIRNSRQGAPGVIVLSGRAINQPLFGGVLVPAADATIPIRGSNSDVVIDASALSMLTPGADLYLQAWFVDAAAPQGLSASPGLKTTTL